MANADVGGLYVSVALDTRAAIAQLKAFNKVLEQSARQMRNLTTGTTGFTKVSNDLNKVTRSAQQASKSVDDIGKAAKRAATPMSVLGAGAQDLLVGLGAARSGNYWYGLAAGARYAKNVSSEVGNLVGGLGEIGIARGAVVGLGSAFAAIGVAAVAAGGAIAVAAGILTKFGVEQAAGLQLMRVQLTGLLESASAAGQEMSFLLALGQESLVPTDALIAADRQLLAFGVTANATRRQLVQFFSDFGTATGASEQQAYYLSLALGQVAAQGKANAIDMRQLANTGINLQTLYGIIGEKMGKSAQEVGAAVKDGIITADRLFPALAEYGARFEETAQEARKTTIGLLQNIQDYIKTQFGLAFEGVNERLATMLQGFYDLLQRIDFGNLADAVTNVFEMISDAMGNVVGNGDGLVTFFNYTLPEAINWVGGAIAEAIKQTQMWWNILQITAKAVEWLAHVVVAGVLQILTAAYDATNMLTLGVGGVIDSMTLKTRDNMVRLSEEASASAESSFGEIQALNTQIDTMWNTTVYKKLVYTVSAVQAGINSGQIPKQAQSAQPKWYIDMMAKQEQLNTPQLPTSSGGGSSGGGGGTSPAETAAKDWLRFMRALINQFKSALEEIRGLTTRSFGEMSRLQEAFSFDSETSQGDRKGIIAMLEQSEKAINNYYEVFTRPRAAGKAAAKAATKERDSLIKGLRKQTRELLRLAKENEATAAELDAWRESEGVRVQGQIDALRNQYDGYTDARGYAVKGIIERAQDSLDLAVQAYEDANAKLEELIAARKDFMDGIMESARGFVNALEISSETIMRFTKLDDVGSFSMVEEQRTKSLQEQMNQRLQILKTWAANIKTLMARGLNADLLKSIVTAGPEAGAEAVQQLVNGAQSGVDEVNKIQQELNATVADLQGATGAAWFDPAIAAQQAVVTQLAAAKAAGEQALLDAQAAYNVRLAQLEAYQQSVEAGTDEHSLVLKDRMELNAIAAATIANSIQDKMAWLTNKDNPKNMVVLGKRAMDGLIAGLESKEGEVAAAANRIANKIKNAISDALQINSPSKVMEQYGEWVGEGLAIGMENSVTRIEGASYAMSSAATSGLGSSGDTLVKVFIGDKELTDIVSTEIVANDARSLDYVVSGRRF